MKILEDLWQVGGAEYTSVEDDYIRSLKFLLQLGADVLCEGHFGIYRGKKNISQFIRSYI